jgi:hypothetical protein
MERVHNYLHDLHHVIICIFPHMDWSASIILQYSVIIKINSDTWHFGSRNAELCTNTWKWRIVKLSTSTKLMPTQNRILRNIIVAVLRNITIYNIYAILWSKYFVIITIYNIYAILRSNYFVIITIYNIYAILWSKYSVVLRYDISLKYFIYINLIPDWKQNL